MSLPVFAGEMSTPVYNYYGENPSLPSPPAPPNDPPSFN
jgi:hypothetical protein